MTRKPRRGRVVAICAALALLSLAVLAPAAYTDIATGKDVRVIFRGKLTPHSLPRTGLAPVRVAVGATIVPDEGTTPPSLRKIQIEINRFGHFDLQGLPLCSYGEIQPSSTANAMASCKSSLVGKGNFSSTVLQPAASPFPSEGALYAFNGTYKGKPAILAHVYGTEPIPTSYTIPFTISKAKGDYGTTLTAPMPNVGNEWGFITGLSLNLGRTFHYRGQRHSYVTAGCPAPKGIGVAPFDFARATFSFGAEKVRSVLSRSCRANG